MTDVGNGGTVTFLTADECASRGIEFRLGTLAECALEKLGWSCSGARGWSFHRDPTRYKLTDSEVIEWVMRNAEPVVLAFLQEGGSRTIDEMGASLHVGRRVVAKACRGLLSRQQIVKVVSGTGTRYRAQPVALMA
jgi:hypothetical protein